MTPQSEFFGRVISVEQAGTSVLTHSVFLPLPLGEGRGEGLAQNTFLFSSRGYAARRSYPEGVLVSPHPNPLPVGEGI